MAELQLAKRFDVLDGCSEMPLHPPSVAGRLRLDSQQTEKVLSMQISFAHAMCLLTALFVAGCASNAAATPLSPFRYEAQAQRHRPVDTVVWLDFRKGIYYLKRQKRYARGSTGSFVCLDEARSNGYRRSLLGLR
jgi:hypothetical protein